MTQKHPFADLLVESQRVTGTRKPIAIVDPALYSYFFTRIDMTDKIELPLKVYLAVALSGGLRVSEALSLRVCDFNQLEGFFKVRVLKKKELIDGANGKLEAHKVYRQCKLHPLALALFRKYVYATKLRNYDYVFSFQRNYIHTHIKQLFGPNACAHSVARHSHISWLLHVKKLSVEMVARIMEISERVVASYNHINQKFELNKVYEGEA